MNILQWLKNNWLVMVLILVIAGLIGKQQSRVIPFAKDSVVTDEMSVGYGARGIAMPSPIGGGIAPVVSDKRLVVQDTNMSMLVKNVAETIKGVEKAAIGNGGYMVNKNLVQPEGAASGEITVRVPVEKREETLDEIRALGVKVVSENVYGNDVTDEYVDLDARIMALEKLKARMEAILEQATQVEDLVNVQMQINNIQEQIDSLKGQKKFLEQTAKLTRISVNLSTDELALPYAPDEAWRPGVVFKLAVRSMVGNLRGIANTLIWAVVYLPIFLILVGLAYLGRWMYRRYLGK